MGIGDIAHAIGSILGRPGYAVGNTFEALGYQGLRPFIGDQREREIRELIGNTNPLTAGVTEGLTGKDPVGLGGSVRRMNQRFQTGASGLVDNPIAEIGLDILGDPLRGVSKVSGPLIGNKAAGLAEAAQADDATRSAKIAAKLISPRAAQSLAAGSGLAGSAPEYAIPGAALVGAARKVPQIDRLVESLYGAGRLTQEAAPVAGSADDLMRQALEKVRGIPVQSADELMSGALADSRAARSGLEDIGGIDTPVSLSRPRPVVNPRVPPPDPNLGIGRSLGEPSALPGQLPTRPALNSGPPMPGNALPAGMPAPEALGRGAIPLPAQTPQLGMGAPAGAADMRMAALQKAIGGSTGKNALFSPEMRTAMATGGRGASGSFLNKAVVSDAQKLQALLNDPETRDQALRMIQELVR